MFCAAGSWMGVFGILRDRESNPRKLFDIFEIMFRKTTKDTEDTKWAKYKNNNYL